MKKGQKRAPTQVIVKYDNRVNEIKTEGAFKDKLDKVNQILKIAGLPKNAFGNS